MQRYDLHVTRLRVTKTYVFEKATPENPIEGDVRYTLGGRVGGFRPTLTFPERD